MAAPIDSPGFALLRRLCARESALRPSVMFVLAHPDDETVGAASLLQRLRLGRFVYVTDGAPRNGYDALAAGCPTRDAYVGLRHGELLSALDSVGVPMSHIEYVGVVDQEAPLHLVPLSRWLETLIREHAPAVVLTHAYEGGHPDHDSTAFAVHAARRRIAAGGGRAPVVAEFTSYHASGERWEFGTFLPSTESEELVRELRPAESALKRRLLGCYASQRGVLQHVQRDVERFRIAPEYDFALPPHSGELLYERYGWGTTGPKWRERARLALEQLEVSPRIVTSLAQVAVESSCR